MAASPAYGKKGLKVRDVDKDHFSSGVKDEPTFSRLVIRFLEGKSLLASDIETGKSDPVAFVWVGSNEDTPDLSSAEEAESGILKTRVCPTTVDPIWNEDVIFPMDVSEIDQLLDLKCLIYVRDEDIEEDGSTSYDELGMVEFSMKHLITKGKAMKNSIVESARWYSLKKSPGMRKVDGTVKLTISLMFGSEDNEVIEQQVDMPALNGGHSTNFTRTSMAQLNSIAQKVQRHFVNPLGSGGKDGMGKDPRLRLSLSGLPRPSSAASARSTSRSSLGSIAQIAPLVRKRPSTAPSNRDDDDKHSYKDKDKSKNKAPPKAGRRYASAVDSSDDYDHHLLDDVIPEDGSHSSSHGKKEEEEGEGEADEKEESVVVKEDVGKSFDAETQELIVVNSAPAAAITTADNTANHTTTRTTTTTTSSLNNNKKKHSDSETTRLTSAVLEELVMPPPGGGDEMVFDEVIQAGVDGVMDTMLDAELDFVDTIQDAADATMKRMKQSVERLFHRGGGGGGGEGGEQGGDQGGDEGADLAKKKGIAGVAVAAVAGAAAGALGVAAAAGKVATGSSSNPKSKMSTSNGHAIASSNAGSSSGKDGASIYAVDYDDILDENRFNPEEAFADQMRMSSSKEHELYDNDGPYIMNNNVLEYGPSRGDRAELNAATSLDSFQKENEKENKNNNKDSLEPEVTTIASAGQGSAVTVARALKRELAQQRRVMEGHLQKLAQATSHGFSKLSDRIAHVEKNIEQNKKGKKKQQLQQQRRSGGYKRSGEGGGRDIADKGADNKLVGYGGSKHRKNSSNDDDEYWYDQPPDRGDEHLPSEAAGDENNDNNSNNGNHQIGSTTGGKSSSSSSSSSSNRSRIQQARMAARGAAASAGAGAGAGARDARLSAATAASEPPMQLMYKGADGRVAAAHMDDNNNHNNGTTTIATGPREESRGVYGGRYKEDTYSPNITSNRAPAVSLDHYQQNVNREQDQQHAKYPLNHDFNQVLERGSLEDVARLLQSTAPQPEQLSASVRNRLYDAIATLLQQNSTHTERCLIWILSLVRGRHGKQLLNEVVGHTKRDIKESLELVAREPSKRGLLASLLKSQLANS